MAFAALDLGGTYVKAGLVDPEWGTTREVARTLTPYVQSRRVADEVDVPRLMQVVRCELERLVESGAQAVLLSNQMHGVVLVDRSLQPMTPMFTWQADLAAHAPGGPAAVVRRLSDALGEATCRRLGNEVRVGLPIVTLACLAEREPSVVAGSTALSIGDFVASSLCGRLVDTHVTNAAASGLFDLVEDEWSMEACEAAGITGVLLPPVITRPDIVGEASLAGSMVPVVSPVGDQQASLAGAGLTPDELSANIATGCQVSRRMSTADTTAPQLRPFLDGDFLATVTHIPAGRALNAFVRLLTDAAPDDDLSAEWSALERRARETSSDLRADVAVFPAANGYPGALIGLTEENMTRGCVFRAALEDVADRVFTAARSVGTSGATRVVFSGGLAYRSALLRDLINERLAMRSRVVGEDSDALLGLAHVAAGIEALA